ncbi:hypothetical protein EI94DRAFT_1750359 [Lactarius quietus]|nr:hypothetical protein EI94DRAFT_1750359 [Lactarius quietus]
MSSRRVSLLRRTFTSARPLDLLLLLATHHPPHRAPASYNSLEPSASSRVSACLETPRNYPPRVPRRRRGAPRGTATRRAQQPRGTAQQRRCRRVHLRCVVVREGVGELRSRAPRACVLRRISNEREKRLGAVGAVSAGVSGASSSLRCQAPACQHPPLSQLLRY